VLARNAASKGDGPQDCDLCRPVAALSRTGLPAQQALCRRDLCCRDDEPQRKRTPEQEARIIAELKRELERRLGTG
jgi:hypothetical protein